MKIIYNKFIPFKGFYAMTFLKWIFVREEYRKYDGTETYKKMLRHENTHLEQIFDFTPKCFPEWLRLTIGGICFYSLYLLEWILKLIPCSIKKHDAYRMISFEQEAYTHENELDYLENRKRFNWIKNIFKI